MVIIFLSWIYIIFTTVNLGFLSVKILSLKTKNLILNSTIGLFTTTILATIWASFQRINVEFHVFYFLLNIFVFLKDKTEIISIYSNFLSKIKALSFPIKLCLSAITFLTLAQTSIKPYIIDNESYYIQSIKWLNEFGLVKGLANLHIFFGQMSGWHIAQSVFSFSFLYKNFNDLSAYCLLLGNVFAILKLHNYFKNNDKKYLIFGLFPLANLFFFQFISAPSPDIPVYVFTFILFYYFIKHFKKIDHKKFKLLIILTLFILFIKPTSVALILIPTIVLVLNFKKNIKKLIPICIVCIVVLALSVIKNTIISGYPFFPMTIFGFSNFDFSVPKNILTFYLNETKATGFSITFSEFKSLTITQLCYKWIFSSKLDGIINLFSVIVCCIAPFFIHKLFNKKSIWILYFTIVIQMLVLFLSSPQFRFFIHLSLFLAFLIATSFVSNKKLLLTINYFSIIILTVFLLVPMRFNTITDNKFLQSNNVFKIENLIFPESNTKYKLLYKTQQIGNLKYNTPINHPFFWGNGNGNLPCINSKQLDYFEKNFNIIPQMRTNNLQDGFYAKKLSKDE